MGHNANSQPRPHAGLRAAVERLMSRLRQDRGDAMIEVLAVMGIVAIVSTMFLQSSISLNRSQNQAHNVDISIQVARGILEQAKATPWNDLAFDSAQVAANYPGGEVFEGRTVVKKTGTMPPSADRISPVVSTTVRGVSVTARTHITYINTRLKQVTVMTAYTARGRASTNTYAITLAAEPGDLNPAVVPRMDLAS